ncbi:lantibiotic dehydratase C-terminal domain-containing protein [Streptomyces sp. AM 4-1-1]|uniref:thiopeptide maturation pyridine synthase n=1 Tax=Streptomyces sp. AM 4-1-1 TaxID=3028710 RepID=UPI0023B8B276|nr:thiopeptide maturation pyridine synthase [Streptomyces sp. AM 4-1-1]WEH37017.1 lantibiotic dehydratase C-terminal domain-containing protein [Streptomyces sp. AM 4-1-1]
MAAIPPTDEPQWRAAHIAYFGDDTDQLILRAVRPVIERCTGHVESIYVLRHWRRGPHLRLVVRATPAVFAELVVPAVTELIGGDLRTRPLAAAPLDEAALLPLHRRLAAAEREPGPLTPFHPDHSITWEEHDRRVDVLGCPVGADELALFYQQTNDLMFEHLESVAAGLPRETLALRLMLATAHTLCRHPQDPSIRRGFVSFRSHADGYLSTVGPQVRDAFEQRYAANRAVLTDQVRAVVAAFDTAAAEPGASDTGATAGPGQAAALRRWVAAIDPLGSRWTALYEAGEIPEAEIPTDEENGIGELLTSSPLHRVISGSATYKQMMYREPRFLRYRLMLNYTYLHLSRLGLPGLTRYLLCHLAANAVEEVYGVSALELVLATATDTPGAPENVTAPARTHR